LTTAENYFHPPKRGSEMVAYQSEERVTYQTLKEWALDSYFNFCRDSGLADRRGHEQVMARLDYTFEGGFERPVEDLMWRVILLVLYSGLHSDWEVQQRKLIADRIADHGLDSLLANVPAEEAEAFRHDLKILKLI
jgi:hypothetical protein